ncbi:rod shape-determining protein MreD [Legionella impletisoli]|uniref:Rod shape-determining protein MreD n=1 Tax=Legionella impletisoli TaxID=343510 RepID=A0A917JZN5_9GAMM|nr:rod shape-determining protein MreD [Legionella impletisoli]GGI91546.1 rod shape-determining protein MreD [Legionella impletisoli]
MKSNVRLIWAIFIVLALSILPMPEWLSAFRPPWVLLLILYIQFCIPVYFNVGLIFVLGLCLDVLLGSVIGEHIFALLLTAWLASGFSRRFTFFPIGQQMLLIMILAMIYQSILLLTNAFLGYAYLSLTVLCSSLLSLMLWPWIRILADGSFHKVSKT